MKDSKLPQEIKALPHWTAHNNKRPVTPPDQWANASTYAEVTAQTDQYGILVAPHTESPYLFIDIDYPRSRKDNPEQSLVPDIPTKEDVMEKMQAEKIVWGSPEHLKLIEPTLRTIKNTSLYPLMQETYTEFSPSGTGIRMIIQSQDKAKFAKAYKKATLFKGQIDFKNQFITITERAYPSTVSAIKEVPLMDLADAFGFRENTQVVLPNTPEMRETFEEAELALNSIPKPEVMAAALKNIPIDQNERIKAVWQELTGEQYEHYHFWLSVGMALHDYSRHFKNPSKVYLAFLEWSEQDPVGYTGEQDVYAKWASFDQLGRPDNITWRTLLKLANKCTFDYPRPIVTKKGVNTGLPMINEWANFEYLLDFYNIKLHEDDAFYVSGDRDVCEQYFMIHGAQRWFDKYYGPLTMQGLIAATIRLCQDSKWRGLTTTANHVNTWVMQPRNDMDLFQLWLDTPFDQLPDELKYVTTTRGNKPATIYDGNSNIDYVFEMLNVQYDAPVERALAKSMLKKTLMQMIKFREPLTLPFTDNGGMLILIGAENTYKSTFFKLLLPRPLDHLRKELNMQVKGEKSVRDFIRNLGRKSIVQIDEFEGMMDHAAQGSLFKAIISGDSASITDIYQTTETQMSRKAIIVGTSNETKQVLSDNGSRRMWFIKVNKINTTGMLQINLHKLYNDLRAEFRSEYADGRMPWLLTQDEINVLYKMNESLSAKSDIAMWLEEVWPTMDKMPKDYLKDVTSVQTDKSGKLFNTKDVLQVLQFRGMPTSIKLPALERALERHCGRWTDSQNKTINLAKPRASLTNGRLCQGETATGKPKYAKWLMPPMTEATSE